MNTLAAIHSNVPRTDKMRICLHMLSHTSQYFDKQDIQTMLDTQIMCEDGIVRNGYQVLYRAHRKIGNALHGFDNAIKEILKWRKHG